MRIALVLPSLAGGGAERVTLNLAQAWLDQGIEVDLVAMQLTGALVSMIPKGTAVFEVARTHNFTFPIGFYRYLRARKPDCVLSIFVDLNAMTLATTKMLRKAMPVAIAFHNHLSSEIAMATGWNKRKKRLSLLALRHLITTKTSIIAVSEQVAEDVSKLLLAKDEQVHTIYNPIISEQTKSLLEQPLPANPVPVDTPWALFVGRLVPAKGLDTLIRAFAMVCQQSPAHLVVLGEGEEEQKLRNLSQQHRLADRVHILGFDLNPFPWLRETNVLVLPSRREGLPTVLIEALAAGTQIVATDCPGGSAEILQHGKLGQLVPPDDPPALATALIAALRGANRIDPDSLRAGTARFAVATAAAHYLDVMCPATKAVNERQAA